MRNISKKGEDIKLISDKNYYVIDALYLNSIKLEITNLDVYLLDKEIEDKIFPYTDAPFAKITTKGFFQVQNIKKTNRDGINPNDKNYFSSDTGLIVFIAEEILLEFLIVYDYDILVETITDDNFSYWDDIISKFNLNSLGLIFAPGIGSGYQFEGSGFYKIY